MAKNRYFDIKVAENGKSWHEEQRYRDNLSKALRMLTVAYDFEYMQLITKHLVRAHDELGVGYEYLAALDEEIQRQAKIYNIDKADLLQEYGKKYSNSYKGLKEAIENIQRVCNYGMGSKKLTD